MPDYFEFIAPADTTIIDMIRTHPSRFYNQDWYLDEEFANRALDGKIHKISIRVLDAARGTLCHQFLPVMPSAGIATYAFLAYWVETGKFLWEHDYTWTRDKDRHGDPIYVGGYSLNKPGFEIHRHLSLRRCHSVALEV